jgi:2-keto-4-pentenoate hydratase/2-oxohepta-3-ene-1,7-dioic acid hydratase in catechol pathway
MRIIRFIDKEGKTRLADDVDGLVYLDGDQVGNGRVVLLEGDIYGQLTLAGEVNTDTIAKLLAPVQPANIFCIGLNYREHAIESGADIPELPVVFMKPTSTLSHPSDPILLPKVQHGSETDYECELAVVIGKAARDVSEEDALDYVLGYTCGHDVSARKWQKNAGGGQWIRGKGFDTFCPLGPALMTADTIPDPQALRISTRLNQQTMQDHTTGDMIFTVRQIIAYLSQDTTLMPGTVILTGTPQGVGFARDPEVWLKAGDETVIEVEKIGRLINPVQAG